MRFTKEQMIAFADFCGRDFNKTSDGWASPQLPMAKPVPTEELLEDFLLEMPPTVEDKKKFQEVHRKLSGMQKPDDSRTEW